MDEMAEIHQRVFGIPVDPGAIFKGSSEGGQNSKLGLTICTSTYIPVNATIHQ